MLTRAAVDNPGCGPRVVSLQGSLLSAPSPDRMHTYRHIFGFIGLLCVLAVSGNLGSSFIFAAVVVFWPLISSDLILGETKYGLTNIVTDQPLLEFLITPNGYSYAFATSPVTISSISGANSYTLTNIGVILRFPNQADYVGSFTFGVYADVGNGSFPVGLPLVSTTVSTITYAPGEFDPTLYATRHEYPVVPTKLTVGAQYWVAAACSFDTPLYIYGTSVGGSPTFGNGLRTLPDASRLVRDPGMGEWKLSFYLIVNTDGSITPLPTTTIPPTTPVPTTRPPPRPAPSGSKKSPGWLIPVIIVCVIVGVLLIAAGVFFGRKYIHCGYSNAIKPHQQQLLDDHS